MRILNLRSHSELQQFETFAERYDYLRLRGTVGEETFGSDRYFNQKFYRSNEWKSIRHHVIIRDDGCDLGIPGREIRERIIIHHMNPMVVEDLIHGNEDILDPEFLISTTHRTHNAIHYGDETLLLQDPIIRTPGDTTLWKR